MCGDSKLLTVKQAAAWLAIPPSSIYELVRTGKITAVRYGTGKRQAVRIEVDAIRDFVDRNRVRSQSAEKRRVKRV